MTVSVDAGPRAAVSKSVHRPRPAIPTVRTRRWCLGRRRVPNRTCRTLDTRTRSPAQPVHTPRTGVHPPSRTPILRVVSLGHRPTTDRFKPSTDPTDPRPERGDRGARGTLRSRWRRVSARQAGTWRDRGTGRSRSLTPEHRPTPKSDRRGGLSGAAGPHDRGPPTRRWPRTRRRRWRGSRVRSARRPGPPSHRRGCRWR